MRLARTAAALLVLAACGDGGGKKPAAPPPPPEPPIAADVSERGVTVFPQLVPLLDGDGGPFPGAANYWDLDLSFALADGYDDQWDGALDLRVGPLPTAAASATFESVAAEVRDLEAFPYDQTYSELTFQTPLLGAESGLVAAAVAGGPGFLVLGGERSAFLLPSADTRLGQVLDLGAATGTITLSVGMDVAPYWGYLSPGTAAPFLPRHRMVLRNPDTGAVLDTLLDSDAPAAGPFTADLSTWAGQRVLLSFELRGMLDGWAAYDDVSVQDGDGTEHVVNGGFETGDLGGWTATIAPQPFGVTSAPRVVGGLSVRRSFHTTPTSYWGRWVDVFENPGTAPVTTDAIYVSDLGSDGSGFIYATPGATGALTSWADRGGDRDVGLVFGSGKAFHRSITAHDAADGSDLVFVVHPITVPAGGKVALAHFVVMSGRSSGAGATDLTPRAAEVDAAAAAIAGGFRTDGAYRAYLTAAQLGAIVNF
jgi:hypothetical protein